jgi:hypothetical protein
MWVGGYSLDNLSPIALTISVGFVVDDAIVMLENLTSYVEDRETPFATRQTEAGFAHGPILSRPETPRALGLTSPAGECLVGFAATVMPPADLQISVATSEIAAPSLRELARSAGCANRLVGYRGAVPLEAR